MTAVSPRPGAVVGSSRHPEIEHSRRPAGANRLEDSERARCLGIHADMRQHRGFKWNGMGRSHFLYIPGSGRRLRWNFHLPWSLCA